MAVSSVPIVLFGAFDRHNLGDILLGRAAAQTALPRPCLFAGLRAADLSPWGGFPVEALDDLADSWPDRYPGAPLDLVHVGGEILDTDAWEAAVMLQDPGEAAAVIARLDGNQVSQTAWAAAVLGNGRPAPYVAGRPVGLPRGMLEFRAVGGVGLARRPAVFQRAVAGALADADRVTVRDGQTLSALRAMGVAAGLVPDPVSGLAEWLAAEAATVPAWQEAYAAVQLAAALGDDATLDILAAGLAALGLPVLLFRAGAAPWHDSLDVCQRLAGRLNLPCRILPSLHVREIVAAIAGARLCLASSLHSLLVAGCLGVSPIGLERRPGEGEKLRAYSETWGGFEVRPVNEELLEFLCHHPIEFIHRRSST